MRLGECRLKCYECRKTSDFEEGAFVERGGKKYWICPHCDMEMPVADKVFLPECASA